MKLMSPAVIAARKQEETAKEILRTQELRKVAEKTRIDLAKAQADFNDMLAKQRHTWAIEEEQHQFHMKQMEKEVKELEYKKAQALIPIEVYKKQADELMKAALEAKNALELKEKELDGVRERLEDKLDAVGQKEQDLSLWNQKLQIKEEALKMESVTTVKRTKELNLRIREFEGTKAKAEADINERKTALVLWDRTLVAKAEKLDRQVDLIKAAKIRLEDERATLDAGFAELREKQKLSP